MAKYGAYLWLSRHGIYYFRATVPGELKRYLSNGHTELRRSLYTGNRPDAIRLAREYRVEFDRICDLLYERGDVSLKKSKTRRRQIKKPSSKSIRADMMMELPDGMKLDFEPHEKEAAMEVIDRYRAEHTESNSTEQSPPDNLDVDVDQGMLFSELAKLVPARRHKKPIKNNNLSRI